MPRRGVLFHLSDQEYFSLLGPRSGFILHHPKITTMKSMARTSPGNIPAIKKSSDRLLRHDAQQYQQYTGGRRLPKTIPSLLFRWNSFAVTIAVHLRNCNAGKGGRGGDHRSAYRFKHRSAYDCRDGKATGYVPQEFVRCVIQPLRNPRIKGYLTHEDKEGNCSKPVTGEGVEKLFPEGRWQHGNC